MLAELTFVRGMFLIGCFLTGGYLSAMFSGVPFDAEKFTIVTITNLIMALVVIGVWSIW